MSSFKEVETRDPAKAVDILFGDAMRVVPELSDTQFRSAYKRMHQSWGEVPLVEGTENEVKSVIRQHATVLAYIAFFKRFSIDVCLADKGYKGEEAAQLYAWVGAGAKVVHLWKTKDKFHAYGAAEFLS